MEKAKNWWNRFRAWLVSQRGIYTILALLAAAVVVFGVWAGINLTSQRQSAQEEAQAEEERQAAVDAENERRAAIVSRMQQLRLAASNQDVEALQTFFENPDLEGEIYVQQGQIKKQNELNPDGGEVLILDVPKKAFYAGHVNEKGEREGWGLQTGYRQNIYITNEGGEQVPIDILSLYDGDFAYDLANGEGTYMRVSDPGTASQQTVIRKGTFLDGQLNGNTTITWNQDGQEWSDEVYVSRGTYKPKLNNGIGYTIARRWNGLKPISLKVYDEAAVNDTYIYDGYLAPEVRLKLHGGNTWID